MANSDTTVKPTDTSLLPPTSAYDDVLRKYGVTPDDMYVPPAPTIYKSNLRKLASITTPLMDNQGETIPKVKGHTGPLMFLEKSGEITPKESRFSGYDGFYIYRVLHPKHGETVLTIGRPEGDKHVPVVDYLDTLKAGAWFQVAEIETGSGFGTYIVVPVQRAK